MKPKKRNAMGARIRELREECGLSIGELSDRIDTSASHLSRIERGLSGPSFPVAAAIAAVLGVSARDLATIDRSQANENGRLVAALVSRGMDEDTAIEIQQRISTSARRALLDVIEH